MVIRPAREFVAAWRPPPAQSQQTQKQTPPPGTPPAPTAQDSRPLTQSDVQKFVRVRRDVRAALGESFTGLQGVWAEVQSGQAPNLLTVVNVLRRAGSSVGQARAAQSAALARENLSAERYAAIRAGVNRALGVPNVDFAQAAQALQSGQVPTLDTAVQTASPREKELIAPFRQELTATAALGLLGL
ncbi:hypothetical protein GCM10010841_21520 [Deinococcus aerophilus]|uniref:Transcriptional regulator n=1 Tax=Deinococcus aerophilus TaxID=522488 RepID=A0ABQ2GTH8_9DEIO|nr:hypothetical protein GCM10010841_21520 [Deinococcus aerophilus]